MRLLYIDDRARRQLKAAVERARAKPLKLADMMKYAVADKEHVTLADRKPEHPRTIASENVLIPRGYRAAISFEEQPPGICLHLSASVDKPGRVPNVPAVDLILDTMGFSPVQSVQTVRVWMEEFEPGHDAVNVLQFVSQHQEGKA